MKPIDFGLRPEGFLTFDLALLHRLQLAGHLRGVRPLPALVQVRRARTYGDGPRDLVAAVRRIAATTSTATDGVRGGAA